MIEFNVNDCIMLGPFATAPPGGGLPSPVSGNFPSDQSHLQPSDSLRSQLVREDWFHGPISRRDAEALLQRVRKSQTVTITYI